MSQCIRINQLKSDQNYRRFGITRMRYIRYSRHNYKTQEDGSVSCIGCDKHATKHSHVIGCNCNECRDGITALVG